jgi:hypothetical protein
LLRSLCSASRKAETAKRATEAKNSIFRRGPQSRSERGPARICNKAPAGIQRERAGASSQQLPLPQPLKGGQRPQAAQGEAVAAQAAQSERPAIPARHRWRPKLRELLARPILEIGPCGCSPLPAFPKTKPRLMKQPRFRGGAGRSERRARQLESRALGQA